jgi:hypothetical protein
MKLSNIILFLSPLAVLGNPVEELASATTSIWASPNPAAVATAGLIAKRDNVCHIITADNQGCDWDPYHGERKYEINPGMTFGVSCFITDGKPVGRDGYRRWDYVPGWGCWVSAKWTDTECEGRFLYTFT